MWGKCLCVFFVCESQLDLLCEWPDVYWSSYESQLDCSHCLTGSRWCKICNKTQNSKGINKLEDGQHPNHKYFFELKSNAIHLLKMSFKSQNTDVRM